MNFLADQPRNLIKRRMEKKKKKPRTLSIIERLVKRGSISVNRNALKNIIGKLLLPDDADTHYYILNYDNIFYTLTNQFQTRLYRSLKGNIDNASVSDEEVIERIIHERYVSQNFTIMRIKRKKGDKKKSEGSFYPFTHNFKGLDLSRYGVYTEFNKENYKENCFIHALQMEGSVDEKSISVIKSMLRDNLVPTSSFSKISAKIGRWIKYSRYSEKTGRFLRKGPTKSAMTKLKVNTAKPITLFIDRTSKHYVLSEKMEHIYKKSFDKFKQTLKLSDLFEDQLTEKYKKALKRKYLRTGDPKELEKRPRRITTDVFFSYLEHNRDLMIEKGFLTRISEKDLSDTIFLDSKKLKFDNITYEDEKDVKPFKKYTKSKLRQKYVYFADFECTTQGYHKAYMVGVVNHVGKKRKIFYGKNFVADFLSFIPSNSVIYFHNLKYDFTFLVNNLVITDFSVEKGNTCYSYTCYYKKKIFKFVDSLKLITKPLRKFPKMFNMGTSIVKEVMPYSLYDEKTVLLKKVKYPKNVDPEVISNAKKWGLDVGDGYFLHMEYAAKYCLQDCEILRRGFMKFRDDVNKVTDIDILTVSSAATLANRYLWKEGCFDGCYKLSSMPRAFIQKTVVGGRVMCRKNKKRIVNEKIYDFDAVSLYPSAMNRPEMGFPLGKPKIWNKDVDLKKCDNYYLEIEILSVEIKYAFPLLNAKEEGGNRVFSNDVKKMFVDRFTLEDLVKFQGVKYKIIRGYYFDSGVNTKIRSIIKKLFEMRLKYKKEKNPVQEVIKLIMNSAYGKTIMKAPESKILYFSSEKKMWDFVERNYCTIIDVEKIGINYRVKQKMSTSDHFSCPHIGSVVLSLSKRIMNEVMCLGVGKIYYQDTDSMQLRARDLKPLSNEFRRVYGRELIGKQMGQFHCDFSGKDRIRTSVRNKRLVLGKEKLHVSTRTCYDGWWEEIFIPHKNERYSNQMYKTRLQESTRRNEEVRQDS